MKEPDPREIGWLIERSRRTVVPRRGPGDFAPYCPLVPAWVAALRAKGIVELGVRRS